MGLYRRPSSTCWRGPAGPGEPHDSWRCRPALYSTPSICAILEEGELMPGPWVPPEVSEQLTPFAREAATRRYEERTGTKLPPETGQPPSTPGGPTEGLGKPEQVPSGPFEETVTLKNGELVTKAYWDELGKETNGRFLQEKLRLLGIEGFNRSEGAKYERIKVAYEKAKAEQTAKEEEYEAAVRRYEANTILLKNGDRVDEEYWKDLGKQPNGKFVQEKLNQLGVEGFHSSKQDKYARQTQI